MRGRRSGKVTIQPTQFIVSMQVTSTVLEGQATETTPFIIPVTRAGNLGYGGTVDWEVTASGTNPATAADFGGTFPSGTLTFGAYDMSSEISMTIYGNDVVEGDRTFTITLSNVTTDGGSGMAMIAIPSAICTIIDDEAGSGGGSATYNGNDALFSSNPTTYTVS